MDPPVGSPATKPTPSAAEVTLGGMAENRSHGTPTAKTGESPDILEHRHMPAVLALVLGLGAVLLIGQSVRGFGPVGSLLAVGLWIGLWTLGTIGAGRPLIDWCNAGREDSDEDIVLTCIAGSAVLAGATVVLSFAGWFRAGPLFGLLVAAAILGAVEISRRPISRPTFEKRTLVLGVLWIVALAVAATVTTFYDQWHQHLGFPWLWLREGSIHVIPRNFYSYMPVNSSLMYAFGLGSLGPWSAQAIHWWSGVMTVLACGLMGRRINADGGGWCAAMIMATTPAVVHLAASGGSDLVVTMFGAGAWVALLRTRDVGALPIRWWLVTGAFAGLAAGTKYTALGTVVLPLAAAAIVLSSPWKAGSMGPLIRGAGAATLGGTITLGPWILRNLLATGAPLFPFMTGPFRQMLKTDPATLDRFSGWLSGFDLSPGHLASGLDLGTFAAPVGGFAPAGLLWLGCAAGVFAVLPRLKRPATETLVVGAAVGIVFWLTGLHVVRYLLPALIPAAAVLGGGLARVLRSSTPSVRWAVVSLVLAAITWNLTTMLHPVGFQRLGCTLGLKPVKPLLERWVSSSLAFDEVKKLPKNAKILLVAESRALGFERAVELEHPFGESRLEELARTNDSIGDMAAVLASEGVTHVLTNRWEARRIAGMRRRPRYFIHGDEPTMERLKLFARHCLDPVWLGHGVSIYRLDPTCSSTGAGDLATW